MAISSEYFLIDFTFLHTANLEKKKFEEKIGAVFLTHL